MHILICAMVGALLSWGVCRKKDSACQGRWALRAGALGAMFPFIDILFSFVSALTGIEMPDRFGLMWSPLLAPFWAGICVMFITIFVRRPWGDLLPAVLVGMMSSILLTMLTPVGIELVPFVSQTRISLGVLNRFDYILFVMTLVVLLLGIFFPLFRRDVARGGIFFIVLYLLSLFYCHFQAKDVGKEYAKALELDVEKIYALPQPLSPFNWRVIVLDKEFFLHDTLINLYREQTLEITDTSTRAYKIQALYRPINEAVWRVYNRFGGQSLTKAQKIYVFKAWHAITKSPYARKMKFTVFSGFTLPPLHNMTNAEACVVFKDLRFEGARKDDKSEFLVCGDAELAHFSILQQFRVNEENQKKQYKVLQK